MCVCVCVCVLTHIHTTRFWALFKNAACLYALRHAIQGFLQDNLCVVAARESNRTEDKHSETVRTISCLDLKGDDVPRNQARILCEGRAMGLMCSFVTGPALHIASKCLTDYNDQRAPVRLLHDFLVMLVEKPEFAKRLMQLAEDGRPLTFITGSKFDAMKDDKHLYTMSVGLSLAHSALVEPNHSDAMCIAMVRVMATHMMKKNLNMSSDLILFEDERRYFAVPASSKTCERTFGFLDYCKRSCQHENIARTNGIGLFRLNDVPTWLESQSKEFVELLFSRACTVAFRGGIMDETAQRALKTQ
eukprot:2782489-Rhodomonas_salina.1